MVVNEIRYALSKDIEAIKEIAQKAYSQYVEAIGKTPAPMIADFHKHLEKDTIFVVEGENNKGIIAYAVIVKKNEEYWLENIAVMPEEAKKGIGTKLINYVENYISDRASEYQLYTNIKMEKNIEWYCRLGFVETKRCIEDGFERVFYIKKLK